MKKILAFIFCLSLAFNVAAQTVQRVPPKADAPRPAVQIAPGAFYDSFEVFMSQPMVDPYGRPLSYYEQAALWNAQIGRISEYRHYPYAPAPYYGGYGGYGYGFGAGYLPFWVDPCQSYFPESGQNPGCVVAEVKFKIMDRGLDDQVVVRIDGQNAGIIGKYSHALTSGLRLRADQEYQITLQWVSKSGVKTIVDRIRPMNMRLQDGPYWYPVSRALFDQAPYGQDVAPERDRIGGKKYTLGDPK